MSIAAISWLRKLPRYRPLHKLSLIKVLLKRDGIYGRDSLRILATHQAYSRLERVSIRGHRIAGHEELAWGIACAAIAARQ